MKVNGRQFRTIWPAPDRRAVQIIDQTRLPHAFVTLTLESCSDAERAISEMQVRGAPLIGVAAAYGVALAMQASASQVALEDSCASLVGTRPTAVNLRWAVERMQSHLTSVAEEDRAEAAWEEAGRIAEEDVDISRGIGRHGARLIEELHQRKGAPVNILTHCNAGWLAAVDHGTALAPVYHAIDSGIPVHVWVDETRPRNQGASLTAWELGQHGVPHTVIVDNAGGHLMQHGQVDVAIVGCDRVTARGDVCNKIGTYLKALAAHDNGVPFYVALPTPTIDWRLEDGVKEIPIEKRSPEEVTHISGIDESGDVRTVQLTPAGTEVENYGFDVTPARLITGLITERGVVAADALAMQTLRD
ncbi:MAG: S-methyl-5-thioribose-1-phosphate isomerase [Candidatus Nanopelagicales bacterium]